MVNRVCSVENLRVRIEYEWDMAAEVLDHLDQWDTPEKYAGNEIIVDHEYDEHGEVVPGTGREVPWDEYKDTYGDKGNYSVFALSVDHRCDGCGGWELIDSITFDVFTPDLMVPGEWLDSPAVYGAGEIPKHVPGPIARMAQDMLHPYLKATDEEIKDAITHLTRTERELDQEGS